MGKKAKTGKRRKDKFYHLAKETGYRARSAFKLIQLNRKFGFLQEASVLIDLCAAPGGWLQVATNNMPISSVVIGIDLDAIKPIKNAITFQADITSEHCRQLLKKELKTCKSDVVLNDGAPNVGTAWVQDAFSQAELALSALKLASEFLKKGGWFITKIFRSKDYTALLWVFQQLFKKVHSTKPQASRSESAEIFVVCQGYLAPDKLDAKFLDPKYVFKEIEQETKVRLNILKPEKRNRQREGYPENNISLHTTITARQFLDATNAVDVLSTTNKITIDEEEIKNHKLTSKEIIQCCEDIKVLGRKELKSLFSWRKKLRKELKIGNDINVEEKDEPTDIEKTEEEKEAELDQMISDLKDEEHKDVKRKKRRIRELKKKLRERLANKLEAADDLGTQEQDLFSLDLMSNKQEVEAVHEDDDAVEEESGSELEFESENEEDEGDSSDEEYAFGDDELYGKKPNKETVEPDEPKMKKRKKSGKSNNPLLVNLDEEDEEVASINKAKQWYQKDIFKDVEDNDVDMDDDYDIEQTLKSYLKKGGKVIEKEKEPEEVLKTDKEVDNAVNGSKEEVEEHVKGDNGDKEAEESEAAVESEVEESEEETDSDYESEIDDRSISQGRELNKKSAKKRKEKFAEEDENSRKDGFEIAPPTKVDLGPEDLALGAAIATSRKRRRDIIDSAYNRYTFNDANLPSWFVEDENKHMVRHMPITREEVEYYKQRMRDMNARPIKKVIEAKAKKKSKMLKKLDGARRKAQGILDASETSNREKQDQIKGIYKRAGLTKKRPPKPTFVVAKKGLAGKRYKRPDNVKGAYKVVDPRMKKDLKAAKNKEKTKGRKRKRGK